MSLNDKSMLVRLNICQFSPNKTDKKLTPEITSAHNAKSDSAKVVKRILPDEALEGIKKIASEARTFHYQQTLPWSDEGARILPTANYMRYTEKMNQFSAQFFDAVEKFKDAYQGYVETARQTLNGMFNENDYPDAESVSNKFRFKAEFSPVPSSDDFRIAITENEMSEIKRGLNDRVKQAEIEAQKDLFKRFAEPIQAMVERLSDPKNHFRDSLVKNIAEMIELIPALNITGDPVLSKLAQEARELTRHTPNRLRDDAITRKQTAAKAKEIMDKMAAYSA